MTFKHSIMTNVQPNDKRTLKNKAEKGVCKRRLGLCCIGRQMLSCCQFRSNAVF